MKRHLRIIDGFPCGFEFPAEGEQSDSAWHKLAVVGKWDGHWMGAFSITEAMMDQMIAHNAAQRVATPADYEHASLFSDRAPASGWLEPGSLQKRKDDAGQAELWGKIDWTAGAADQIRAREYRYLSPSFVWNTRDRKSGAMTGASLHSVALTNKPFLHELPEVRLNSDLARLFGAPEEDEPMNPEQFAALCKSLGIPETSTYDAAMSAVSRACSAVANSAKLMQALNLQPNATVDAACAEILRLQNPANTASAQEVAALREQLRDRDARDAVANAQREGKIGAEGTESHAWALKAAKEHPQMFADWVKIAPKQIALGDPKTPPAPKTSDEKVAALTAEEREVCKQLGISPEEYVKEDRPRS